MQLIEDWTRNLRYRPYEKWPESYLKLLKEKIATSHWRLDYHVQAPTGLLNDPNGFASFNGQWHLFFQYYPFGPVHGLKSWYHVTSKNLVDWQEQGIALFPDTSWDSQGVYSGSAFAFHDQLFIAYTGNVRDDNWHRLTYQLGAVMDTDNHIKKLPKPLFSVHPAGITDHFRDPQLLFYQGSYLLLIGAQTTAKKGELLVYESDSLEGSWHLRGPLQVGQEDLGYMVECPNLVFIAGKAVLLFCPQGLPQAKLAYQNIYPNTYLVAENFDLEKVALNAPNSLKNLDDGFDLYATQAFNAPDGRVLAISWCGLPEIAYPSDQEGWAHCLSLVKELTLKDDKLYQHPVAEYQELRATQQQQQTGPLTTVTELFEIEQNRYELHLEVAAESKGRLSLFADAKGEHGLDLRFDTKIGQLVLDRSRVSRPFAENYGLTRTLTLLPKQALRLEIFVDQSLCEIFINDGAQTMTTRIFPEISETKAFIEGNSGSFKAAFWTLRQAKKN